LGARTAISLGFTPPFYKCRYAFGYAGPLSDLAGVLAPFKSGFGQLGIRCHECLFQFWELVRQTLFYLCGDVLGRLKYFRGGTVVFR